MPITAAFDFYFTPRQYINILYRYEKGSVFIIAADAYAIA